MCADGSARTGRRAGTSRSELLGGACPVARRGHPDNRRAELIQQRLVWMALSTNNKNYRFASYWADGQASSCAIAAGPAVLLARQSSTWAKDSSGCRQDLKRGAEQKLHQEKISAGQQTA